MSPNTESRNIKSMRVFFISILNIIIFVVYINVIEKYFNIDSIKLIVILLVLCINFNKLFIGDIVKVVKEEIITSGQQEGLSYRQVTYEDGGFRQFDVETGKLIGSSYDSDQDNLPKMD